jgi:hypothetical protein
MIPSFTSQYFYSLVFFPAVPELSDYVEPTPWFAAAKRTTRHTPRSRQQGFFFLGQRYADLQRKELLTSMS